MNEKTLVKAKFNGVNFVAALLALFVAATLILLLASDGDEVLIGITLAAGLPLIAIFTVWLVAMNQRELTVTNLRVIAKGAFGSKIELPLGRITHASTYAFNGIGCGTPSAKIRLYFCINKTEVLEAISFEMLQRDNGGQDVAAGNGQSNSFANTKVELPEL